MVIVKADLLPEKEEILEEMPSLLERVTPSSRVLIENLEFHTKSRSRFGLLSSAYLITQRFSLLELQIAYLKCPYDIQEKISSYVKEKWFNEWYAACIDYYHYYSYDIWESWSTTIYFPDASGVGGVSFPANSLPPNDPIFKAWKYGMVLYLTQIPDPKSQFFSTLTKFQQCMFRKIHWIISSPENPAKIPDRRSLRLEIYSAMIEYENGRAKPAHYLIQIVDYDDFNDQRREWVPDRRELVTDPALARAIGFYNIYHQSWALIEQGKVLMHCGNTTFAYKYEFKDYMKVEGAVSEDIFDYLFDVGAGKFLSEKGKKNLLKIFEKWDPEHLKQMEEDFEDYPDNDGLEDLMGEEGMQNLNND